MAKSNDKKISLRVTQASLNQTAMDLPRNLANIYEAIRIAVDEGSDILALEELALTGYEANDDFQKTDNKRILASLQDIAAYAAALDPNLIISVGHPWRYANRNVIGQSGATPDRVKDGMYNRLGLPYNVQTLISGGKIHGMTAKANLFNDERGYEKRYFAEWSIADANRNGGVSGTVKIPLGESGQTIPFGRPTYHITDGKKSFAIAHAICEEKWVATRYDSDLVNETNYQWDNIIPWISRELRSKQGLVLLVPDASPPAPDKIDKHRFLTGLASGYADAVINTDGLGSSGSTFAQFGHRMVAQKGTVISSGNRASFKRVATTTTDIQIDSLPERSKAYTHGKPIKHGFEQRTPEPHLIKNDADWDSPENPDRVYEETVRMTALWLFDYMRKTGSRGIAEALSGGADSAFNCVMIATMVNLAMDELGVEGFCETMDYLPYVEKVRTVGKMAGKEAAVQECLKHMLTAAFMGTNNSSKGPGSTQNAAQVLIEGGKDQYGMPVEGIGGKFMDRNVQDLLDFYGTIYAVEDTSAVAPDRLENIRKEVSAYLNKKPGSATQAQLKQEADEIKARYPEIENLVSAADPKTLVGYENIQARGRQVLIMMIANVEGKMAIANPNLDEARNAYATFGGDLHAGTLNLNAHLPKRFQLQIMEYLYEKGLHGVMPPVRALGPILYEAPGVKRNPTAELQPRDESGAVVQTDEVAMKGTFAQLNQVAEYMLYDRKKSRDGSRRLNAAEVFKACKKDEMFKDINETELYDMVRFRYQRWATAQHKVHASPIAPTFGRNVDHQTSLRTPNLSGESRDELTLLGVKLLFNRAAQDGLGWSKQDKKLMERRALQDEGFIHEFEKALRSGSGAVDYDLDHVYERVKEKGWNGVFAELPDSHPIMVIHNAQMSGPK